MQEVTNSSWFGTVSTSNQISGAVKYPLGTKGQRGYVLYQTELEENQWVACNCFNYFHTSNPIVLPYEEPEQRILNGEVEYKQAYSLFEMTAYRKEIIDGWINE